MILTQAEKTRLAKMIDDEVFAKFLDGMYEAAKEDMANGPMGPNMMDFMVQNKVQCIVIKKIKDTMKDYLARVQPPVPENS